MKIIKNINSGRLEIINLKFVSDINQINPTRVNITLYKEVMTSPTPIIWRGAGNMSNFGQNFFEIDKKVL